MATTVPVDAKNPEMIRPVSVGVGDRVISCQNMYLTSQLYIDVHWCPPSNSFTG
jgi:hypothetical protein